MRVKKSVAIMLAVALLSPNVAMNAALANENPSRETVGEKMDDAAITSKVKMELMGNRGTSALRTKVDTSNGVVTLTGKAKNVSEKELASEIAKKVKGVKKVVNEITVEPAR